MSAYGSESGKGGSMSDYLTPDVCLRCSGKITGKVCRNCGVTFTGHFMRLERHRKIRFIVLPKVAEVLPYHIAKDRRVSGWLKRTKFGWLSIKLYHKRRIQPI